MKAVLASVMSVLCIGVIVLGNIHWQNQIESMAMAGISNETSGSTINDKDPLALQQSDDSPDAQLEQLEWLTSQLPESLAEKIVNSGSAGNRCIC